MILPSLGRTANTPAMSGQKLVDLTKVPGLVVGHSASGPDATASGYRTDGNGNIISYFGPDYRNTPPSGAAATAKWFATAAAEASASQNATEAATALSAGQPAGVDGTAHSRTDDDVDRMLTELEFFKQSAVRSPGK